VLAQIKHLAPDVPVVVRTIDDVNLANLQAAGATEVVPEAIEASLMLASHALALVGVPMRKVLRMVQDQRDARYSLLKGYFHGEDDNTPEDAENEHLSTFTVHAHAHCIGKTVDSLALPDIGVRVASLRRVGAQREDCTPDTVLHVGDTLVLSGTTTALAVAEEMLTRRENNTSSTTSARCPTGRPLACSFATSRRCCKTQGVSGADRRLCAPLHGPDTASQRCGGRAGCTRVSSWARWWPTSWGGFCAHPQERQAALHHGGRNL
jgi:Trk K+ transport system NAD-binding subunit